MKKHQGKHKPRRDGDEQQWEHSKFKCSRDLALCPASYPHTREAASGFFLAYALGTPPSGEAAIAAPGEQVAVEGGSLSVLSVWLNSKGSTGPTGEHSPAPDPL